MKEGYLEPLTPITLEKQLLPPPGSITYDSIIGSRAPTIIDYTKAQHDHSNAANGGHLAQSAFATNTLVPQTILNEVAAGSSSIDTSAYATVTNWSGTFDSSGGSLLFFLEFTYWRKTSGTTSNFKLLVDGTLSYTFKQYTNELNSHKMCSRTIAVVGVVDAGSDIAVAVQAQAVTGGTVEFDSGDYCRLTMLELP